MKAFKTTALLLSALLPLCFLSCSANIIGQVEERGAAGLVFRVSFKPAASGLIRSLKNFLGGPPAPGTGTADAQNMPVLDGPALGRSMAAAPGAGEVSLRNTGPDTLDGTVSIVNVGDFLFSGEESSRFINYAEGAAPGSSSLVIRVDRESAPHIISALSPEAGEYLSALMAPAVTGERSTVQEYLRLVASVYGRPLAAEIAEARIEASIVFPRQVIEVEGGVVSDDRMAYFDIPLADLLVLETPLRYGVHW